MSEYKQSYLYLLAPLSVISFASFILNDASDYSRKADHLGIITGFTAISYISSSFLSLNWISSLIGLIIATSAVVSYLVIQFEYKMHRIISGFVLLVVSCAINSYFVERKDKQEFIDMSENDLMHSDLIQVLKKLP